MSPKTAPAKPNKVITREDVAHAAGVSLATAALALNNHPRVAGATRQRVMDAALRLGFVANHAARRLAGMREDSRAKTFDQVGLLYFLDAKVGGEAVFLSVVGGVEEELSRLDASLVLARISDDADWAKFDRLVLSGLVDAWLLFGNIDEQALARVEAAGVRYAILGDHRCARPAHVVSIDHYEGARMMAHHIAELGHRRVAYFAGSMRHVYQRRQFDGYRQGAIEAGLDTDVALVAHPRDVFPIPPKESDATPADAFKAWELYQRQHEEHPRLLSRWLKARPLVTAIITSEFGWTGEVCATLGRLGLRVPQDISVLGCEPVSRSSQHMMFSHVALPMQEIGRQGARLLRQCVTDPDTAPARLDISPALVSGHTACRISNTNSHTPRNSP
jgi:DNA-binding LacI/PurR family transcriptional regulator